MHLAPGRVNKYTTVRCLLVLFAMGIITPRLFAETDCDAIGCQASHPRWFAEVDYLRAWTDDHQPLPLITEGSNGQTQSQAGVLGQPGTSLLFDAGDTTSDQLDGTRLRLRRTLHGDEKTAIGLEVFYLADRDGGIDFSIASDGSDIISRPFFDPQIPAQASELVSFPNVVQGSVTVDSTSKVFGAAAHLRRILRNDCCATTTGFIGYRHLTYDETGGVTEDLASIDPGGVVAIGTTFLVQDHIATENDFNGLDLGFNYSVGHKCVDFSTTLRMAFGSMNREAIVDGLTTVTVPSVAPTQTPGGLLAVPSNIGAYESSRFSVVPEIQFRATCWMTSCIACSVGYTGLIMIDTWRSFDQFESTINPSQIGGGTLTGPNRPLYQTNSRNVQLQSIDFGLTMVW